MSALPHACRRFCPVLVLTIVFCLGLAAISSAAPDLTAPIAKLTLPDGRVLEQVELKSYGSKSVMVRHSAGVAQIPYEQFPAEYQAALLEKRPAPGPAATSTPPPARASNPKPSAHPPGAGASRPAAEAGRVITGRMYLQGHSQQLLLAGVPVFAIKADVMARFDAERRGHLTLEHEQLRQRLSGAAPVGDVPSREEAQKFFEDEYNSWLNSPRAVGMAKTDEKGEFTIQLPDDSRVVIFARLLLRTGTNNAFHIWAVPVRGEPVMLSGATTYPALSAEAPSYE